jgi:hypothetical protein
MNHDLNKYTKAELISKIKDSKKESKPNLVSNNINQIKSYFSQIWDLMLTFKNILLKLTLISLLVNLSKKYKIFRKIWSVINSIVMSIFGLSIIDNFGFEFITKFLIEIRIITSVITDYLSNTQFYNYLVKLFNVRNQTQINTGLTEIQKVDNVTEIQKLDKVTEIQKLDSLRKSSEGIWTSSDNPHKVSSWLKGESSEIHEKVEGIKPESNNHYKKYIAIIGGIIIVSSLSWDYSDEIIGGMTSTWEWIKSFRSGPPSSPTSDSDSNRTFIPTNTNSNLINVETPPDIEMENTRSLVSSPSLDNWNRQAADSWREITRTPESDSSTQTVTPQSFIEQPSKGKSPERSVDFDEIDTYGASSSSNTIVESSYILSDLEKEIIDRIKFEWKDIIQKTIKARILFIENQFVLDKTISPRVSKQMVSYLVDIENSTDKKIESMKDFKEGEIEWMENKLLLELQNNWIKQYHDLIIKNISHD